MNNLDQYYTNLSVANKCFEDLIQTLNDNNISIPVTLFVEPSGGTGNFYNLFPKNNRISYDIDPKHGEIIKADFLKLKSIDKNLNDYETIVFCGNPPFGKNSSLAVKFINKSVELNSDYTAFILPKTFKKKSIINRLHENLHLIFEKDLDDFSFVYEKKPYDVPCVFQIYETKVDKRPKILVEYFSNDFTFMKEEKDSDFAIQRVGANAGKVKEFNTNDKTSKSSHYYIKELKKGVKERFINFYSNNLYDGIKYNTSGNPSISKSELIEIYNDTT